jgi:hypothetical protein
VPSYGIEIIDIECVLPCFRHRFSQSKFCLHKMARLSWGQIFEVRAFFVSAFEVWCQTYIWHCCFIQNNTCVGQTCKKVETCMIRDQVLLFLCHIARQRSSVVASFCYNLYHDWTHTSSEVKGACPLPTINAIVRWLSFSRYSDRSMGPNRC